MCKVDNYRGFLIYHNKGGNDFGSKYLSIVNPNITFDRNKNPHCHVSDGSIKLARQIIDTAIQLQTLGYSNARRSVKNKAMRLNNYYILSR